MVINTHVTVSGIRDDLSKIGEEGQVNSVRIDCVHLIDKSGIFTVVQVQPRFANPVFKESNNLYLSLAHSENYLPRLRGLVLDGMS